MNLVILHSPIGPDIDVISNHLSSSVMILILTKLPNTLLSAEGSVIFFHRSRSVRPRLSAGYKFQPGGPSYTTQKEEIITTRH